jgi:hypothetical protein
VTYKSYCLIGLFSGLLAFCVRAHADPNDYVIDLDFEAGEREFDAKLGAASAAPNGAPAAQAAALAWGRGMTPAWFTEFYAQFANSTGGSRGGGFDALSWENVVRFSDPGEWPVDLGAMVEVERPRVAAQGWKITSGPLLQTDIDLLQLNANFLFTRVVDGPPYGPVQFGYQVQVKYRAAELLEYGIQAFGDMGAWNRWGDSGVQSHRAGPAIFGRYRLAPGRAVKYNAALLFGASHGAPDQTVRAQLEYEF